MRCNFMTSFLDGVRLLNERTNGRTNERTNEMDKLTITIVPIVRVLEYNVFKVA